jgi:hypothetical protein
MSAIDAARLAHHQSTLHTTRGHKFAGVFLNITKAYDRVHRGKLMSKINNRFSILPWIIAWLHEWLSDRSVAVRFQGALATYVPVKHGLPQDPHFSALLFQLFIDDISVDDNDLLFMVIAPSLPR